MARYRIRGMHSLLFAKAKTASARMSWFKTQLTTIRRAPLNPRGAFLMAAELGFEPRHTESESAVLPLHNSAIY